MKSIRAISPRRRGSMLRKSAEKSASRKQEPVVNPTPEREVRLGKIARAYARGAYTVDVSATALRIMDNHAVDSFSAGETSVEFPQRSTIS
jgi:hypothetical protein